jgi:hypothetical protein
MLKNITLSADEALITRARARAQAQNATLNDEFRRWLENFVAATPQLGFRELMASLSEVSPGKSFTREEANER